mgnify:CR=1 FL=1
MKRLPLLLVVVVCMVGSLFASVHLYQWNPEEAPGLLPCVFHALTGLHCPGCGGQRAVHHLLHGRFLLALRHNALMFLVGSMFAAEAIARTRGAQPSVFESVWAARLTVASFFAFVILRNVPIWPMLWLAPPM